MSKITLLHVLSIAVTLALLLLVFELVRRQAPVRALRDPVAAGSRDAVRAGRLDSAGSLSRRPAPWGCRS